MSIVVTGIGALSALGNDVDELWASVERGDHGFGPISRFDVSPFAIKIGAMAPVGDQYDDNQERLVVYGYTAGNEALERAHVNDRTRVALMLGTSSGFEGQEIHICSTIIAQRLGLGGPVITLATACTSSTHALGLAADLLKHDEVDIVLAGGVDILCHNIFAGFNTLGILSKEPCTPFGTTMGTSLGEGGAFMVVETSQSAANRGVEPFAYLLGYGFSADAYHDTRPEPSGRGMARALESAMLDARVEPSGIDYYNAHGTGTSTNDASEWRALQSAFGEWAERLPVSSSKSFVGHAQGAAGALEAIITLLAMERQVVPPTINVTKLRPFAPADPVALSAPRPHAVDKVLCANAAFGGANGALIFSRDAPEDVVQFGEPRSICLTGAQTVFDWDRLVKNVPRGELRTLDASARLLANAVSGVLLDSEIGLHTDECEPIGIIAGQRSASPESAFAFEQSIKERGRAHLSAQAFVRMVVSSATGTCCRLFGLKGPTTTLSTGAGSGLVAFVLSANHLAWREDSDQLLAAAVDEAREEDSFNHASACILLEAKTEAQVQLAAWALGADRVEAKEKVLNKAGYVAEEVVSMSVEGAPATASLQAVVKAFELIMSGEPGPFLVSDGNLGTAGAAVILEAKNRV